MVKKMIALVVSLCCMVSIAQAGTVEQTDAPIVRDHLNLEFTQEKQNSAYDEDSQESSLIYLAAAEQELSNKMQESGSNAASEYEDRMFTGNKIHKYLGIGSIAAAVLTALSPKEEDGPHEYFAKTSAVLGIGAVATGLGFHYEDIGMDGGLKDPDNLHALWAGLGAIGIASAAAIGPDSPHQTLGTLGGIAMIIGVKYTW